MLPINTPPNFDADVTPVEIFAAQMPDGSFRYGNNQQQADNSAILTKFTQQFPQMFKDMDTAKAGFYDESGDQYFVINYNKYDNKVSGSTTINDPQFIVDMFQVILNTDTSAEQALLGANTNISFAIRTNSYGDTIEVSFAIRDGKYEIYSLSRGPYFTADDQGLFDQIKTLTTREMAINEFGVAAQRVDSLTDIPVQRDDLPGFTFLTDFNNEGIVVSRPPRTELNLTHPEPITFTLVNKIEAGVPVAGIRDFLGFAVAEAYRISENGAFDIEMNGIKIHYNVYGVSAPQVDENFQDSNLVVEINKNYSGYTTSSDDVDDILKAALSGLPPGNTVGVVIATESGQYVKMFGAGLLPSGDVALRLYNDSPENEAIVGKYGLSTIHPDTPTPHTDAVRDAEGIQGADGIVPGGR